MRRWLWLVLVLVLFPTRASAEPAVGGCPMYPADNVWNTDVSLLPVHQRSGAWTASMGSATARLHPDFGGPYGIPYTVVDSSHATTSVAFQWPDESDAGPYPFGPDTPIEGGSDRHALMVDRDACRLYELYDARYAPAGSTAGSGAVWDLRSNALRPAGWTSADAAGLPLTAGLLRRDEVAAGFVGHAIRFTASRTDRSYLWPARHQAGAAADPDLPPMGARFRLRSSFDLSRFGRDAQVVLRAMQRYGMLLADNGSNWYFTGATDPGWSDQMISDLKTVPASAFEAVDESSLMISPDSGRARQLLAAAAGVGYRLVAADGGLFSYGDVRYFGSMGGRALNSPVVGMAAVPGGAGYWMVAADGGMFAFGSAGFFGSMGGRPLNSPVVAMAPAAAQAGRGYWQVAADGGMFAFGSAGFFGSMGGRRLNSPVVGMAPTASGRGYWLVAADGGMFAFGDAGFYGSMGGRRLNSPIVGMAPSGTGRGYWLVAADGGMFSFGDAGFFGSAGGYRLDAPIVGMAASPSKAGYWLVGADGAVFNFGDAPYLGSPAGSPLARPVVAVG
ncbi:MAG TPA: hypothetical protein VGO92_02475 [Acidimicrobiales bacterium]|jgi:hypothetical protein|nr:hypothetical protein [Acidimicrobiales bacterium]